MKNCLFIGDCYDEEYERIISSLSVSQSPFSSLRFNRKIINGLKQNNISTTVLSAPYIDSWPKCKILYFKSKSNCNDIYLASYFNVPPFKNFSRYRNLKKQLQNILSNSKFDFVFISEMHLPFVKLIKYIKKCNANCKIVLCVLDLPELMYLGSRKRPIYNFFKKREIKHLKKFCDMVDVFYLLSKHMMESKIITPNKKVFVRETIIENIHANVFDSRYDHAKPIVVYSGTLSKQFGIEKLLKAFALRKSDYELHIAGCGECQQLVVDAANRDSNLKFFGLLVGNNYKSFLKKADYFVNPRSDDNQFSKYSFPSKIGEYCSYKKPIISFDMEVLNEDFKFAMYISLSNSAEELAKTIDEAISSKKNYLLKCNNAEKLSLKYSEKMIIKDLIGLL